MHFSALPTLLMAGTTLAGSINTPIVRERAATDVGLDLDLADYPVLDIVSALVDKLPVDVSVSSNLLEKVDVTGLLSCVTDQLPVDAHVGALEFSSSAAAATTYVTTTTTTYVARSEETAAAAGAKRDIIPDIDLDLNKIPVLNLVAGLAHKLGVDANVDVLPNNLEDLKDIDLQAALSCLGEKLQGAASA